jgi:hypothetical protein
MAPLVAVSLVVTMAGVALVLNRLWIDAAGAELTNAAESAALAAAGELAGDPLLYDGASSADSRSRERLTSARRLAARIAARNRVAGSPVELDSSPNGDIRFGRLAINHQQRLTRFLETDIAPTTVVVTARGARRRANPVFLLMQGLAGRPAADVSRIAEATIDNRIVGLRPFAGVPVPALPIAILQLDPLGERTDCWDVQIEQRQGRDEYRFSRSAGRVVRGSDGWPEIVLVSAAPKTPAGDTNIQCIDVGTALQMGGMLRQVQDGWTVDDVNSHGGQLLVGKDPLQFNCAGTIPRELSTALQEQIGRIRICLLYSNHKATGPGSLGTLDGTALVAGRIMAVRRQADGVCLVTMQPAVVTTRTAILADATTAGDQTDSGRNRYIYKLQLTQ